MGEPLYGKDAIIEYTNFKEKALDEAIKLAGFPHFKLGNRLCSHTEAIDRWFVELSLKRVQIGENSGEEDEDGKKRGGVSL